MMAANVAVQWIQTLVVLFLCLAEIQTSVAVSETVKNYYETLNVEQTATNSQIKKSFRKLAARHHPDKNKRPDAEATFREIAEAYSVLSNSKKRSLYDYMGHKAFLQRDASVDAEYEDETSFDFSFSDFFQGFDDDHLADEPQFHWSVHQEEDDFITFEGLNFNFDFEFNEDEPYY